MLRSLKAKYRNRIMELVEKAMFPYIDRIIASNIDYLQYSKNKKKKVVYTCLTGKYDILKLHEYINYEYDYACFTDIPELLKMHTYGMWKIMPIVYSELDGARNNRWHKMHPHVLFPDYDESIYIDSNINIATDFIFKKLEERKGAIVIPIHDDRDDVYEELKVVSQRKLDNAINFQKMTKFLKINNFPEHYGLNECGIIYRKHHDKLVIEMMEQWWEFVKDYTKRDQLSFPYVLWKHNLKPSDIGIESFRYHPNDVKLVYHLNQI